MTVVEADEHVGHHMRHHVLAKLPARVGEPVRELVRLRQQQQASVVVDEGREDDEFGLNRVVRTVWAIVAHTGHPTAVVAVHAVTHCPRDQLEVAGRIGLGQLGDKDARLRTDVAAERLAEAAIGAGGPILIGFREDRARRRERVIAELARRGFEQHGALVQAQRRQRVVATARRFEHVAAVNLASLQIARLAGNAQLVFGLIVIALKVRIAQRPVGERGVLRNCGRSITRDRMRPRAEVILVEAPRHGAVVDGAAARLIAVVLQRERSCPRIRVGPPRDGLTLDVRA